MIIDQRASYLVLSNEPGQDPHVAIVESLSIAITGWTAGSRVSPIWPVRKYTGSRSGHDDLKGESHVVFLGPVQPARLTAELPSLAKPGKFEVWLTAGCFNIILRSGAKADVDEVLKWAKDHSTPYEHWLVRDGKVIKQFHHVHRSGDLSTGLGALAKLAAEKTDTALKATIQENITLTATALARSASMYPAARAEFETIIAATLGAFDAYKQQELSTIDLQLLLLNLNAAISRFSSQAFSGTPPIVGTECHLWIHSLLGTGSANIALSRLVGWIQQTMGAAKLPQRLASLQNDRNNVPSLDALSTSTDLLGRDPMSGKDPAEDQPQVPLITYFSGRDGFSSHMQTVSAPLTTISECNSYRSSLLTVTHEMSHIFVQMFFNDIYPSANSPEDLAWVMQIVSPKYVAETWLDSARQLLLEALIGFEMASSGGKLAGAKLEQEMPTILQAWRREAQEIVVHTFDFSYFYQGDPEFYIKSIWHSWCAIPGIRDRVPHYLMRTLCAVSFLYLKETPATRFKAALRNTRTVLAELAEETGLLSVYVHDAVELIDRIQADEQLNAQYEKKYSARLQLVRLVAIFFYSDTLAAKLFGDPHVGKGRGSEGKQMLTYDQEPAGNPLSFLRRHLKTEPTEAESLWVLHTLAFDVGLNALGGVHDAA